MSENRTFIACLDLLATKESAAVQTSSAESKMRYFRNYLAFHCSVLDDKSANAVVRAYGDFAYIQCDNIKLLFKYLTKVRTDLFRERVFFKGAVSVGRLNLKSFHEDFKSEKNAGREASLKAWSLQGAQDNNPQFLNRATKIFDAVYFGADAIKTIELYERFKGIGFIIDDQLSYECINEENIVNSVYGDAIGREAWRPYKDLALSSVEAAGLIKFMDAFRYASLKNKSHSKYYFPYIVTSINSLDLKQLEYGPSGSSENQETKGSKRSWVRTGGGDEEAAIFDYFFTTGEYFLFFSSVLGYLVPVAKMIEKVYADRNLIERYRAESISSDSLLIKILNSFARRKQQFEQIAKLNHLCFRKDIKEHFVQMHVEFANRERA